MPIFVVEISGRGIVAFDAPDDLEARARLADKAFLRDLYVLQSEGRALWDGASEIHVRAALPEEIATWQARYGTGEQSAPGTEKGRRIFLVPVVDPSTAHDEEDDSDDHDHGD